MLLLFMGCGARLTDDRKSVIKSELAQMVQVDQIAAYLPQGKYEAYSKEEWNSFKDSVFTNHKNRIESMFNKYGFLGFDRVGKEGSNHFWLLVQHCDKYPDFQKAVLRSMNKHVKRGNASPNNYAFLYDRVKINAGEAQLFGTQVTYEVGTTGRAVPKNGLIDSANVDQLRKEYDLSPLKKYLNDMTEMHFNMNREHYKGLGIMKPQLYQ